MFSDPVAARRVSALKIRVEKCREAVATFVRIQEEMLSLQKTSATHAAREKLARLMEVNRTTLSQLKQSLAFAEVELNRVEES